MTKNNQKTIIILIIILLLFTSIMAVLISSNIKENNNDNKQNSNVPSNETTINEEISKLKNSKEYFAVQGTINNIFIKSKNPSELLTYFSQDYILENDLNEENILKFLKIENDSLNFYAEEIYYNANSSVTYYFTKGYTLDYPAEEDIVKYNNLVFYLLIVDNRNHYVLKPLENIDNLEEYAKSYDKKAITIENDSLFNISEITDDNKLITYISNFINLMYLDVDKAYEMLDLKTKEIYPNINSFVNNRDNINNGLFTKFWATSTKENEDNIVYKVQNHDGDTITITEYYPNDYSIGFKFEGE